MTKLNCGESKTPVLKILSVYRTLSRYIGKTNYDSFDLLTNHCISQITLTLPVRAVACLNERGLECKTLPTSLPPSPPLLEILKVKNKQILYLKPYEIVASPVPHKTVTSDAYCFVKYFLIG